MIKLKKMKKKEKYENLDKIINKNIDKLKPTNNLIDNYNYISDDKNDHTLDYDIDMSDIYIKEDINLMMMIVYLILFQNYMKNMILNISQEKKLNLL